VIRHHIFQTQSAEPAIRKVQVHFLAQAPFGANAEAVSDNQHPNHKLRIDRAPTRMTVEGSEEGAQIGKI
jgi:hypothetical protein